jgi:hypothetical protein
VPFIGPEAVGDDQSSVVMELQWLRLLLKMRGRNGGRGGEKRVHRLWEWKGR